MLEFLMALLTFHADAEMANAGLLSAILSLGQVGTGVAGLLAGRKQADFQDELASAAVEDRRREAKRLLSRQRVAFAKGGVVVDTGSPLDVQIDTAAEEELSSLRAGLPFSIRGERFKNEGRNALFSGLSAAAGTIVNQVGPLGPLVAKPKTVNVPGGVTTKQQTILANPSPARRP